MRTCAMLGAAAMLSVSAAAAEPDWLNQPTLNERREEAPAATEAKGAKRIPDGPNLLKNGNFERGRSTQPGHWSLLDRLTTRWTGGGPSGRGKCLRIDTDVYLDEWKRNKRVRAAGGAGLSEKTPTKGDKYDTVAGTHGVHIYSPYITVKRDEYYMLSVAMRGPSAEIFFPKVFVKGYRLVNGDWAEVWRGPLHCRTHPQQWREFKWRGPKCPFKYGAQRVKVIIYAYWPPGVYQVDDVRFWRVDPKSHRARPGERRPHNLTPLPDSPADAGPVEDDSPDSDVERAEPRDEPTRY